MSADNGIYILVTRGKGRRGKEYRIAHVQAVENLYYKPDYPQGSRMINAEYARAAFGESRVFHDAKIALGYAERILDEHEKDGGIVEYGVATLDCSHIRFPKAAANQGYFGYRTQSRPDPEYFGYRRH